ncbi:MAG: PcfB family protein [Butyrivibrio sp.]|nr:PcfB family protein [Butyrivibrio sp.]
MVRLLKIGKFVVGKVKEAAFKEPSEAHGKMSIKKLIRKDEGATSVDVAKTDLRDFQRVARKYGVDFAVVRHNDQSPPVYSVFFKARDQDAITDVIRHYTEKKLMKEERPSLMERLKVLKEKVASAPRKVLHRAKERMR